LQGKHEAAKPYRNTPFIPPFPRNKHKNSKPVHLQQLKRFSVQAAKQLCVAGARCSYIYKYSCTLHHRNTHWKSALYTSGKTTGATSFLAPPPAFMPFL